MPGSKKPAIAIAVLILSHAVVLLAGFFAPYDFDTQDRDSGFCSSEPSAPLRCSTPSSSSALRISMGAADGRLEGNIGRIDQWHFLSGFLLLVTLMR